MLDDTPRKNPVRSLSVYASPDSGFTTALSSSFSSITGWSQYERMSPILSIVSNICSRSTRAYTVMWTLEDPSKNLHFMHTMVIQKHSMPLRAMRPLQPRDSRLITPFFNVSPEEYADKPEKLTSLLPADIPWIKECTVRTSIDAVILDDHTIEGEDLFGLRHAYISTRHAEHDAGVSALYFLQNNTRISAAGLDVELSQRASSCLLNAERAKTRAERIYLTGRAQEAENLRGTLKWHGLDGCRSDIQRRVRYSREHITASA